MRLSKFTVKNYKGIEHIELKMPIRSDERPGSGDFLSIVGQNNCSKSSILEALDMALGSERTAQIDEYHNHDPSHFIEVELEFDNITDSDKKLRAVGSHVYGDTYTIRKTWKKPGARPERSVRVASLEYAAFPQGDKREDYLSSEDWKDAVGIYERDKETTFKPKVKTLEELKRIAREQKLPAVRLAKHASWTEDTSKEDDWRRDEEYKPNPGGWASNLASAMPRTIYIPAIQQTNEISDPSKRQSAIRKILLEIFENRLNTTTEMARLRNAVSDISRLFDADQRAAAVSDIEMGISQEIQRIIDIEAKLSLAPVSAKDLCSDLLGRTELRLRDRRFGPLTRPEHQGHGAQRALVLCLLQILAEQMYQRDSAHQSSLLLLVEEPEIYLHPEMCRRMRDTLLTIAQTGRAQVICTTHSPVFLDLADRHDGIVVLRRRAGKLESTQRAEDVFGLDKEQKDRLRMIINFDPTVNEIFFSERVCLVEGETEIASVQAVADKLCNTQESAKDASMLRERYHQQRRKVAIVNCRGKGTIPAFQHVLNHFCIEYRIIHDCDLPSDTYEPVTRADKAARTNNLNISSLIPAELHKERLRVHYPCLEEHVLGYPPKDKEKAWNAVRAVENTELTEQHIQFFEFALGVSLASLKAGPELDKTIDDLASRRVGQTPGKRNTRDKISFMQLPSAAKKKKLSCSEAIGIAAGSGRIYELSDDAYLRVDGMDNTFIAQVVGNSMEDTLRNGDFVWMKRIDTFLNSVTDEEGIDVAAFSRIIKNNAIYALAINHGIEDYAYTLKRVRIDVLSEKKWLCRIVADNPSSAWGDEGGSRVILKSDRVHFAAELVGFVAMGERNDVERKTPSETESAG